MKNFTSLFLIGLLFITCKNSDPKNIGFDLFSDSTTEFDTPLTIKRFSKNEISQNSDFKEPISKKLIKKGN